MIGDEERDAVLAESYDSARAIVADIAALAAETGDDRDAALAERLTAHLDALTFDLSAIDASS